MFMAIGYVSVGWIVKESPEGLSCKVVNFGEIALAASLREVVRCSH